MRPSMLFGLFLLLTVMIAPAAWSQSSGLCYFAEVPGPIVLPDNSFEESGRLEVCLSQMYSPVAGVHRTSVNGRFAGMYLSRKVTGSSVLDDDRPYFVLARLSDGAYRLDSYGWTDGQTHVTYEMRPVTVRSRWQVRQDNVQSKDVAESAYGKTLLIASVATAR